MIYCRRVSLSTNLKELRLFWKNALHTPEVPKLAFETILRRAMLIRTADTFSKGDGLRGKDREELLAAYERAIDRHAMAEGYADAKKDLVTTDLKNNVYLMTALYQAVEAGCIPAILAIGTFKELVTEIGRVVKTIYGGIETTVTLTPLGKAVKDGNVAAIQALHEIGVKVTISALGERRRESYWINRRKKVTVEEFSVSALSINKSATEVQALLKELSKGVMIAARLEKFQPRSPHSKT